MKNKKLIICIFSLILVILVGFSFAYYGNIVDLKNNFITSIYGTTTTENFKSPSNWKPGDTTEKKVSVTNTGDKNIVVRVCIDNSTGTWENLDGDTWNNSVDEAALINETEDNISTCNNSSDWVKKEEDDKVCYYYTKELGPNETTTSSPIESVTYNKDVTTSQTCTKTIDGKVTEVKCSSSGQGYDDASYSLPITIDTVQSNFIEDAWGYTLDDLQDSSGLCVAKLKTGFETCQTWAKLSGNDEIAACAYYPLNSNITNIIKTNDLSVDSYETISSDDSDYPIYTWFDDGTIYIYSKTEKIHMNEDSMILFGGMSSITNLDLSYFDTSLVVHMSFMFSDCESLTKLDLSNFDTSNVTDMGYMFKCCWRLTELNLSNFDTSNVTDMGGMFERCFSLTELNLNKFDTDSVRKMNYMFSSCTSLTKLDLSNFDTSNVTDFSGMFNSCINLTELDLSNFDTSKATDMGYMFKGCNSLTELEIRNFDTSKATDMGYMFKGCSSLTKLEIRNFDTSKVTDMGYMFEDCSSLTELDIGNFNTSNVTNMSWMFRNCTNLNTIYVSDKFTTESVTYGTYMFSGCTNLKGAISYDSDKTDYTYANYETGYFTLKA